MCEGPPLKKVALIPNTFLASKAKPTSASALGKPVSALDSLLKEEELRKKGLFTSIYIYIFYDSVMSEADYF